MVRWFRLYPGLARDEKLLSAALRSKQPIERVVWLWLVILESASEHGETGAYEIDLEECGWFLRVEPGELQLILGALTELGRIADGHVTAWRRRQFASDRSAARTRAWRDRQRLNGQKTTVSVSGPSQGRHGDAPEAESESESEKVTGSDVLRHWNLLAKRIGRPVVNELTAQTRQGLDHLVAAYTADDFVTVLAKVECSRFLRGERGGARWEGATLDWLSRRTNFTKTLAGNFDD